MIPQLLLALVLLGGARVNLVYLGNMGVLVTGGGKTVVIDALQRGELEGYAAVPPVLLEPLEQARSPFAAIDLLLTTHRHRDHFNAASVASRVVADTHAAYVAAQETVDTLVAATTGLAAHPRVRGIVPPVGRSTRLQLHGADVEVLDLPHNPTRSRRVANVGFIVTIAGLRILHTGDANPDSATFAAHALRGRVDVAIVPFWYFARENDGVQAAIGARTWVASHVPLADTTKVQRDVRSVAPHAIVLSTPGAQYVLP